MTLFSTKTDSDLSFVYLDSTAAVIQRQSILLYSSCVARVGWVGVWVCLCMFEFVIKVKIQSK